MEGSFVYGDNVYIDDSYMDEEWEYIYGIEGYMISNKARVWSERSQKFLKLKKMDKHGYLGVCLYLNGKRIYKYIHRLVAEAFIQNPNNYPIVRHINDDPLFNEEQELEWGTQLDNIMDSIRNGNFYWITDSDRIKAHEKQMMPLTAINIKTGEKKYFQSQNEASRRLNIPQANIHKVLRGQRRYAGKYTFKEGKL